MCYYFDDIIKLDDFNLNNILIDEKSQENSLVSSIWYRTLIGSKPLHIMFDKIDGFIRVSDGNRYLALFGAEKYHSINKQESISSRSKKWHYICFFS